MIGLDLDKAKVSSYQPSGDVKLLTRKIKTDYQTGWDVLHSPYREFNDMSLLERMDKDQKAYNNWTPPKSLDPDEKWRWDGNRGLAQEKIMTMLAQVTARTIIPKVFAQNDEDEDDEVAGNVMRDLLEYNVDNSNYEISWLFGNLAALVNPVSYMSMDYSETYQTIKERSDNGDITKKEVLDEVLSGMQANNIPADEILLTNAYEYEMQKQKAVVRRRFIDFSEAERKYGDHPNFDIVTLGVKCLFNDVDGMFYEQYDDDNKGLVEEAVYYNRLEDLEVAYVNGIYMGDANVDDNAIKHRDNRNAPKYPIVKFGFEPIDEKSFAFYRSLMMKLEKKNELLDDMWRVSMDTAIMGSVMPVVTKNAGEIDGSVMLPGKVTDIPEDADVIPMQTTNPVPALRAVQEVEKGLHESSTEEVLSGKLPDASQKAFNVARAETNARILMGTYGKMAGKASTDLGDLMIDLTIHHQTMAEAEEVLGGMTKLKFRQFILPDKEEKGNKKTKILKFTDELMKPMTDEEVKKVEKRLFGESGGLKGKQSIYLINPRKFRMFKFKVKVEPDVMLPRNEEMLKELDLQAYREMAQGNPYIDLEQVTRDFLVKPFAKGETEKYLKKAQDLVGQVGKPEATPMAQGAKIQAPKELQGII